MLSGDLDAAGDLSVERLQSERWRSDALVAIQEYADRKRAPVDAVKPRHWREVLAQPKVIEALAPVGRIEKFNLAR